MKLFIDSYFRETGTPESYTIKMAFPAKYIKNLRLVGAFVPKTIYPVRTGFNDTLDFTYSGAKTAVMSQKNYTGSQLAAELESKIQTAISSSNVTVAYDEQTNKLTFTESAGTAFTVATQTTTVDVKKVLGVAGGETCTSSSVEATNQVDLSYPRYLLLDVDCGQSFGEGVNTVANSHSFVVPMTSSDFLDLENYTEASFFQQQEAAANLSFQTVRIDWKTPDAADLQTDFFEGIDHQILFDLAE